MEIFQHSHLEGDEKLPNQEKTEILKALGQCETPVIRGRARELRDEILRRLLKCGWSGKVQVAHGSRITIASQKNKVGLCMQTGGNMSRMYADLIKLQQLYLDNIIDVGVFILPTAPAAKKMGDSRCT